MPVDKILIWLKKVNESIKEFLRYPVQGSQRLTLLS